MCSLGTSVEPPISDRVPIIDHAENEKVTWHQFFCRFFWPIIFNNFIHCRTFPIEPTFVNSTHVQRSTEVLFGFRCDKRLSRYLSTLSESTFKGRLLLKNVLSVSANFFFKSSNPDSLRIGPTISHLSNSSGTLSCQITVH